MKKLKVLLINSVIGGATSTGRHVRDISQILIEKGVQCWIAYTQHCDEGIPENAFRFGSIIENKLHGLVSRVTGKSGYYSSRGTRQLLAKIEELAPNVVHIHNIHSNDICLPLLFEYLKEKKIPTVINLHDCWFYTARCFHYTRIKCEQWKTECKNCPQKCRSTGYWFSNQAKMLFEDKKKWYSDWENLHIVGVSNWIATEARRSMLKDKDISTIYNWIDTEKFSWRTQDQLRKEYGLESKFVILGVSGYWNEEKGAHWVFAFSDYLKEDEKLVMIGRVAKDIKEKYSDKILFLSPIYDREKLAQMYAMADVYINLSEEESFGLTNAEALACGTPLLLFRSTASTEFVTEGCGYAAEVGDMLDLRKGLNWIKANSSNELRKKCANFAKSAFNKEKNVGEYYALYKRVLREGKE